MYSDYSSTASFGGGSMFFCLVVCVVFIVAMWKMFVKAGEPGVASIVPFWNTWVLYKITWGSGAAMFLLLIPLVNVVISIITMFKLAKVFGKGVGFGFGLLFFPIIFFPILAFSSNVQYIGVQK